MLQGGRALNVGIAKYAGKLQPVSQTPVEADVREPNECKFAAQRRPCFQASSPSANGST